MAKIRERVFEGTWEEMIQHKAEFEGLRLRLIGYQEETPEMLDKALAELLAEADTLQPESGRKSADPCSAAVSEIIAEKYRKQGFQI